MAEPSDPKRDLARQAPSERKSDAATALQPTLFRFIARYSWRQQALLLALTAASFPTLYASLDLPKQIINKAIGGSIFPQSILGYSLNQIEYLMLLSVIFLLLVAINGGFKYIINVYKGQLGERMLRRLRYQLFTRVLRFPSSHFRKTSSGELIAMITAEVEPLGGFIGEAIAQPAFELRTMLTILAFMYIQDWVLGLAATALYPVQMYVIPRLQRQVNLLAKERIRAVRRLSERIGETVSCIDEIHTNDTSELERAIFARWAGLIYEIRYKIYKKKFFIKFLNAFLGQLTPFFFYSIGGYLVIRGQLTFGALVAVLAAYKDLADPWKELLNWYQQKEDARVKYTQLVEQFEPAGLLSDALQQVDAAPPRLHGRVIASNVTLEDESGIKLLDAVSFSFPITDKVAFVGDSSSGNRYVAKLLARLEIPTSGSVAIGDFNLTTAPESVLGRRVAYVGEHVSLINGSIRDNLVYVLKHRPVEMPIEPARTGPQEARRIREALASGNTTSDIDAEWIDYAEVGVEGPDALDQRIVEILADLDFLDDLFAWGLRGTINPVAMPHTARRILEARQAMAERLASQPFAGLVEPFDPTRINRNMSTAENLLFGTPVGPVFNLDNIARNKYVASILDETGLTDEFVRIGHRVARIMLDLFHDLPAEHEFFERFSFISADSLKDYQAAIRRADAEGLDRISQADRILFVSLPFKLIPDRHRLAFLDDAVAQRLLRARQLFAEKLPAGLRSSIAFFDPAAYNPAATVMDNILFGKIVYGRPNGARDVGALVAAVLDELGLRPLILNLGLDFHVGIGGGRLTVPQRQKIAIARSLLKDADLLILDRAVTALDPMTREKVLCRISRPESTAGIVYTAESDTEARHFPVRYVMQSGRVVDPAPSPAKDPDGPDGQSPSQSSIPLDSATR